MTILNQTDVLVNHYPSGWWFILAVIPFIIGIVCWIKDDCEDAIGLGFAVSLMSLLVIGVVWLGFTPKVASGRSQYEVLINDQYPVTELYEKYDVIDKRGDIWIIEDK